MGTSTRSLKRLDTETPQTLQEPEKPEAPPDEIASLASAIRDTRGLLGNTLEEIHEALNPAVFKEEIMKHFHEVKTSLKEELSAELGNVKDAVKASVVETKESLKEGIQETRAALTQSVKEEISDAQQAFRAATLGKVETIFENAQDTAKATGRALSTTVSENPVPFALIGLGAGWLMMTRMRKTPLVSKGVRALASGAESAFSSVVDEGSRLKNRAGELFETHPIVVAAAVAALGAAVGVAIPVSRWEREHVSEARAVVLTKAEALAHQALERVSAVANGLSEAQAETSLSGENDTAPDSDEATTERDGRNYPSAEGRLGMPAVADHTDRNGTIG